MGWKDLMKNVTDKATSVAETAQAKFEEQKQLSAIKKEEQNKKMEEMNERVTEYEQELLQNILSGFSGAPCIEVEDNILDFTKDYFEKLLLPANSVSASKITMYPYSDKIQKKAQKALREYDDTETPVFQFEGNKGEFILMTPTKLYIAVAFPENQTFVANVAVDLQQVSQLGFVSTEEGYQVVCNGVELFSADNVSEFDRIGQVCYMKLLKAIFAAMCVGVTLLFLYFENQLSVISLAIAVGFYVVASAIHLVFHECGHFFGGLVSKYKLLFFRFGPFNLVKTEKTKIKFTWLKTHGGQCVMYPSQTSTIKYKAYNLGGVIANAIIAALSTLLMLPNNFYLLMMMIELVFVGAYKILVNLIPHKTNGVPNDGYIVKMLDAHIAMRKDYALYLRIYADTFLNKAISPSDYQYERNESLSDDELLYYNEIQEILKSINAQMSKHEIDHCKGIVI